MYFDFPDKEEWGYYRKDTKNRTQKRGYFYQKTAARNRSGKRRNVYLKDGAEKRTILTTRRHRRA